MNSKFLLPTAMLTLAGWSLAPAPVRADTVLAQTVGFIKGTQIFTDSFDITSPGVLTVTLTDVPWLDTLSDLNCFLTSPTGGVLGAAYNGGFDSVQVQPGAVTVNWYGTAAGTYGTGVYSVNIDFKPAATVPLPAALPLLLSGLGILSVWRRSRRDQVVAC